MDGGKRVTIVGAGGNIGSHLVGHIARMADVGSVVLIDPDVYEAANLPGQEIEQRDVGIAKVEVLKRKLGLINPDLQLTTFQEFVEDVPLALLRADVILAALDTRASRQYVNQAAWRLGVPWIDSGVRAEGLLARVRAYVPSQDAPCLECGWSDRDYDSIEQAYPCLKGNNATPPTNAPSSLGALAASMLAIECGKTLRGQFDLTAVGREVLVDAAHHKYHVNSYLRRPECRFDHNTWHIEQLTGAISHLTARKVLESHAPGAGSDSFRLYVQGKRFVQEVACRDCGRREAVRSLVGKTIRPAVSCTCGAEMSPVGFTTLEYLSPTHTPTAMLEAPLSKLGLRQGDVVTLRCEAGEIHYELIEGA